MSKLKKFIIGIGILAFLLIAGAGFLLLQRPGGTEAVSNNTSDQSQSTLIPNASVQPDMNYLKDQIFHPVGGGG